MFAYCGNNPVNNLDILGANAEALEDWITNMAWLPFADSVGLVNDIVYYGGILILGVIALACTIDSAPEISCEEGYVSYDPPSPSNNDGDDDDDDDDEYYDDDSNFGGRQKMGKNKGNAPRNNQAQNRQFKDATQGLTRQQQRILHNKISGKGLGFHEIKKLGKDLFCVTVGFSILEE